MQREFPMCESSRVGSAPNQVWVWQNLKLQYYTSVTSVTSDYFTSSQKKKKKEEEDYRRSEATEATEATNKSLEDYSDAS